MSSRALKIGALFAGFSFLVPPAASASQAPSSGNGEPFVFGAVLSLTGAISSAGRDTEAGLKAAISQINAEGGINGRHVEFKFLNSASKPSQALLAAKKLIGKDHVDFLYADIYSADAFAIEPFTTSQKFFTITDGATPGLGNPKKFPYAFEYFDAAPRRGDAVAGAVDHIVTTRKLGKKVAILTGSDPAEVAVGNKVKADLPKLDLRLTRDLTFSGNPTDLSPQLEKLRASGADVVQVDTAATNGVKAVMTSMETLGWHAPVVFDPTSLHGDLLSQVPSAVRKQFSAVDYASATRQGPSVPSKYKSFVAALKKNGDSNINNLGFAESASSIAFLAKWTFIHAQQEYHNTDAQSLTRTLDHIGNHHYTAAGSFGTLFLNNPGYTPQVHNTLNANYSHFWAVIRPSKNIDGTYVGNSFALPAVLSH